MYIFTHWTELQGTDPLVVSSEPSLSFPSGVDRVLEAHFIALPFITPQSALADGMITFSWPAGAAGWILQESPDRSPASWVNSTRTVETVGAQNQVSVPTSGGGVFFRLARP